jgi:polysaccharide export outer membrane protein
MSFFNKIFLLFILGIFIHSCTNYKDLVLLQENENIKTDSLGFYPYDVPAYRIQQRDILYIRIISMNREVSEILNTNPTSGSNVFNNEASFYIYGYNVSDSGYVEIPIVGEVHVVGKTLEEAKALIVSQTKTLLKDPTVIVKLISFKYSVLGEVNSPGVYTNFNNQLTVLEAISKAGDISPFGERSKVTVIRPSPEGTKTHHLDLTDKAILISDGFFLLPNDIVYVEPVKSRNFRNNIPVWSLFLTTLTTFILVLSYVQPK